MSYNVYLIIQDKKTQKLLPLSEDIFQENLKKWTYTQLYINTKTNCIFSQSQYEASSSWWALEMTTHVLVFFFLGKRGVSVQTPTRQYYVSTINMEEKPGIEAQQYMPLRFPKIVSNHYN